MDLYTRLVLLARFFNIDRKELRLRAARMAANEGGRYGSRSNVDNLFVRKNSSGNLTIANKVKAPPILDELFTKVLGELSLEKQWPIDVDNARLNSTVDAFLEALQRPPEEGWGLSVQEMLSCLPSDEQHLVNTFANLGVGEALKLPEAMQLNRSELVELASPLCGRYALYRFSSTRHDELELSEELFEIEITDTSICRMHGHGGGLYEGVMIFGGDGITSTMNHTAHKGHSHVFFFITMLVGPIYRRNTFLANLVMHSEFNELRFYNAVVVRKGEEFQPRGKDTQDPELFLTLYPVLAHRHIDMEIRNERHEVICNIHHPVSVTRRTDGDALIRQGLKLRDAYKAHPGRFTDEMLNAEILYEAQAILDEGNA